MWSAALALIGVALLVGTAAAHLPARAGKLAERAASCDRSVIATVLRVDQSNEESQTVVLQVDRTLIGKETPKEIVLRSPTRVHEKQSYLFFLRGSTTPYEDLAERGQEMQIESGETELVARVIRDLHDALENNDAARISATLLDGVAAQSASFRYHCALGFVLAAKGNAIPATTWARVDALLADPAIDSAVKPLLRQTRPALPVRPRP